jgi:hypothetical protein
MFGIYNTRLPTAKCVPPVCSARMFLQDNDGRFCKGSSKGWGILFNEGI